MQLRDPVTGLYTVSIWRRCVPGLIARDDRAGVSQLTLVLLRVDILDAIGGRHGRPAADRILAVLGGRYAARPARAISRRVLTTQGLAIFLQCGEVDQARAFCRRLGTLLRSEQLDWRGDVVKIAVPARVLPYAAPANPWRCCLHVQRKSSGIGPRCRVDRIVA